MTPTRSAGSAAPRQAASTKLSQSRKSSDAADSIAAERPVPLHRPGVAVPRPALPAPFTLLEAMQRSVPDRPGARAGAIVTDLSERLQATIAELTPSIEAAVSNVALANLKLEADTQGREAGGVAWPLPRPNVNRVRASGSDGWWATVRAQSSRVPGHGCCAPVRRDRTATVADSLSRPCCGRRAARRHVAWRPGRRDRIGGRGRCHRRWRIEMTDAGRRPTSEACGRVPIAGGRSSARPRRRRTAWWCAARGRTTSDGGGGRHGPPRRRRTEDRGRHVLPRASLLR